MDPSYNNSPSQGQSPIISSGSAPASPAPTPSATPAPIPQAPVSSGDIVLSSGKPKSKKPLIFTLVAVALISIIVSIVVICFNPSSSETQDAFNIFGNFILYGNKSTDKIEGKFSANTDYYIDEQVKNVDLFGTFIEETKALKSDADLFINSLDENKNGDLINAWTVLGNQLQLAEIYYSKSILRYSDISKYYTENGASKTKKYVSTYYSNNYTNNIFLNNLNETNTNRGNAIVDRLDIFSNVGCFESVEMANCFNNNASDEQQLEAEILYEEYRENNSDYMNYENFYREIVYKIYSINDILNGAANEN